MSIVVLIAIQLIVTVAGFAFMWRRLDIVTSELTRVRRLLETLELARFSNAAVRRTQPARAEPAFAGSAEPANPPQAWTPPRTPAPPARPALPPKPAQRLLMANDAPEEAAGLRGAVTPELARLLACLIVGAAPSVALFFSAPLVGVVTAGLAIAAATMLVALRPLWRASAWAGLLGAATWSAVGLVTSAAALAPMAFAGAVTAAGLCATIHARFAGLWSGALMAAVGAMSLAALGLTVGMVGSAGIGLGLLTAAGAVAGASSLRAEALHVGALFAGGAGLFVLSGQEGAAVWFTPAIAWYGALFLAISMVRTPVLGARGLMLAATGAIAPLLAAGSLFASEHALADPRAAAGAFAVLAVILSALIAVAAQRHGRGIVALKLTAWALAAGALTAFAAATLLALPAPLAAIVLAMAGVALTALDWRMPQALWRAAAIGAFACAAAASWIGASVDWPAYIYAPLGVLAPAALASVAALIAQRRPAILTAGVFEALAIAGALIGGSLLLHWTLTASAPGTPLGFVEASAHITLWLGAALALAWRSDHGASDVRRAAVALLGLWALCAGAVAALLWLTPHWSARPASGLYWDLFQHQPLGFAMPAILAWAHWTFWRGRGRHVRARAAMAMATLATAGFATLEIVAARADASTAVDPLTVTGAVLAFAVAIGLNLAPGVTSERALNLHLDKYFQRDRAREQRL